MLPAEFSRSVARNLASLGVTYSDIIETPEPAWVPAAPVSLINDDVVFEGQSLRALLQMAPQRSLSEVLEDFGAVMVEANQRRDCSPSRWRTIAEEVTGLSRAQVHRFVVPVNRYEGIPVDYREEMRAFSAQMVALIAYTYPGGVLFDKPNYFGYVPQGREIVGVVARRLHWPGFPSDERGWSTVIRGVRPYQYAAANTTPRVDSHAKRLWTVLGTKFSLPQDHPLRLAILVIAYAAPRTFTRSGMWVKTAQFRNNHYNIEQARRWRDMEPRYQYIWLLSNLCPAVMTQAEFRSVFRAPARKYDADEMVETHRQWDEALAQLTPTRLLAA